MNVAKKLSAHLMKYLLCTVCQQIRVQTRLVMEPEYRVVRPRHVHLGLGHHVGLDAVEHAQHGEAVSFHRFRYFMT